ncbi:hypothetical protein EXN66_Car017180 [Channa argus]|uniref:Uncharacterized protein n=1 Tax=Channa argus TaxID=215402 RepID=A0A6G1QG10_CHAAH|nr:hypothetical protein EXN66_Car017180 [Channa argus]
MHMSDHQCPGNSKTCDPHLDGIPEFTWSIVAAGDLRQERNEKIEKKDGSPQGSEEEWVFSIPCLPPVSPAKARVNMITR